MFIHIPGCFGLLRDCDPEVFPRWKLPHLPLLSHHQLQLMASLRAPYLRVWLSSSQRWSWSQNSFNPANLSAFVCYRESESRVLLESRCWEQEFLELLLFTFHGHLHYVGFRENRHRATVLGFVYSHVVFPLTVNKSTVHYKSPVFWVLLFTATPQSATAFCDTNLFNLLLSNRSLAFGFCCV